MTDERYKKIMADLGMPNSRSLLQALQQVANEAAQEVRAAERERWQRIATNAQAVTTGCQDRIDYFKVPSHLMAALALALAEGPNVEVTGKPPHGAAGAR